MFVCTVCTEGKHPCVAAGRFGYHCVGISHHVTCHVTDHRTHIAAAVAPSFLESTLLQSTGYDLYCTSLLPFYTTADCMQLSYYLCNCRQLCTADYVIFTR